MQSAAHDVTFLWPVVGLEKTLKFLGKLKLQNFDEVLIHKKKKLSLTNLGLLGKYTAMKTVISKRKDLHCHTPMKTVTNQC